MANIKQAILVRTDLKLSTGLLAAQVAHIHAKVMYKALQVVDSWDALRDWVANPYITVHALQFQELLQLYVVKCVEKNIPVEVWEDTIYIDVGQQKLVFEKMKIGAAIGPCDSDLIKSVIGDLPLL